MPGENETPEQNVPMSDATETTSNPDSTEPSPAASPGKKAKLSDSQAENTEPKETDDSRAAEREAARKAKLERLENIKAKVEVFTDYHSYNLFSGGFLNKLMPVTQRTQTLVLRPYRAHSTFPMTDHHVSCFCLQLLAGVIAMKSLDPDEAKKIVSCLIKMGEKQCVAMLNNTIFLEAMIVKFATLAGVALEEEKVEL